MLKVLHSTKCSGIRWKIESTYEDLALCWGKLCFWDSSCISGSSHQFYEECVRKKSERSLCNPSEGKNIYATYTWFGSRVGPLIFSNWDKIHITILKWCTFAMLRDHHTCQVSKHLHRLPTPPTKAKQKQKQKRARAHVRTHTHTNNPFPVKQ